MTTINVPNNATYEDLMDSLSQDKEAYEAFAGLKNMWTVDDKQLAIVAYTVGNFHGANQVMEALDGEDYESLELALIEIFGEDEFRGMPWRYLDHDMCETVIIEGY